MVTNYHDAEKLIAACAAGYVPKGHPDVQQAVSTLGRENADRILCSRTSDYDALQRRVAGSYGTKRRR
jgi:hypothetical protein